MAVGKDSQLLNTTGSGNSSFGNNTLDACTTGYHNCAFGYNALTDNTDGYSNTAIGYEAAANTTSGNNNTALGREALFTNILGDRNIAIGYRSLYTYDRSTSHDSYNVGVGNESLYNTTTGAYNVGDVITGANSGAKATLITGTVTHGTSAVFLGYSQEDLGAVKGVEIRTVSYTHLTLPTKA